MSLTPPKLPISVKGIVFDASKVWLRKNERGEWELPGGRLEEGEQPAQTVVRELDEELGFTVIVKNILQADVYAIKVGGGETRDILVLSYVCTLQSKSGEFELEGEAGPSEFRAFKLSEINLINMPQFYRDAIAQAANQEKLV